MFWGFFPKNFLEILENFSLKIFWHFRRYFPKKKNSAIFRGFFPKKFSQQFFEDLVPKKLSSKFWDFFSENYPKFFFR
jgi:hypothetical protein